MTTMTRDISDVRFSEVFTLNELNGMRWHCANHMCRSPFFQMSYDNYIACNGCMVRPPQSVLDRCIVTTNDFQPLTPIDPQRDIARNLEDVQKGPYREIETQSNVHDNFRMWVIE